MNLSRRGFFTGLIAAPAVIRTPSLLMPIKPFMSDFNLGLSGFQFQDHTHSISGWEIDGYWPIFPYLQEHALR